MGKETKKIRICYARRQICEPQKDPKGNVIDGWYKWTLIPAIGVCTCKRPITLSNSKKNQCECGLVWMGNGRAYDGSKSLEDYTCIFKAA